MLSAIVSAIVDFDGFVLLAAFIYALAKVRKLARIIENIEKRSERWRLNEKVVRKRLTAILPHDLPLPPWLECPSCHALFSLDAVKCPRCKEKLGAH